MPRKESHNIPLGPRLSTSSYSVAHFHYYYYCYYYYYYHHYYYTQSAKNARALTIVALRITQ